MTKSVSVKSVTLRYSSEEDRLFLRCNTDTTEHYPVWWTQRLWLRAFPVLINWLEGHSPKGGEELSDQYQARAQQQADEELVRCTERNRAERSASNSASNMEEKSEVSSSRIAPILCTKVEFAFQKHAMKMTMADGDNRFELEVVMSVQQLRQFLLALSRCLQSSEWPKNTPNWLLPESNTSSAFGEALH